MNVHGTLRHSAGPSAYSILYSPFLISFLWRITHLSRLSSNGTSSGKPAWIWSLNVPGVKQPAKGVAPVVAANFSTTRWLVFLEDRRLASLRWYKLQNSPLFSLDLWHTCHHFSFCRWLFHLEIKVGATSVASCCKIWGLPAPLFAGYQGLRTLRKFSFTLWQESGTTPSFSILGGMQRLGHIYLEAWLWQLFFSSIFTSVPLG